MLFPDSFPLNLANGQHVVTINGAPGGQHEVSLTCLTYPSTGTAAIEYKLAGSALWVPMLPTTPLSGPVRAAAHGPIAQYRITLAGITGGRNLRARVDSVPATGFPDGTFLGTRAVTVQPYTEANVKNGVQFYVRAVWDLADPILAGTTRKIAFQTGAKQVIVKQRDFQFVAEEMRLNLYRAPVGVTGGAPLVVHNYNGVGPVASTVTAAKNVNTTSDGVEFDGDDPESFFGASAVAQRTNASIPQGRERILPPNMSFLVAITNTGTGNARAQYFLDWYEGGSDLPLVG